MRGRNRSVTWSMSISVNGFISSSVSRYVIGYGAVQEQFRSSYEQVCEQVCDRV